MFLDLEYFTKTLTDYITGDILLGSLFWKQQTFLYCVMLEVNFVYFESTRTLVSLLQIYPVVMEGAVSEKRQNTAWYHTEISPNFP